MYPSMYPVFKGRGAGRRA